MACLNPLHGWVSRRRNKSGKRSVVFKPLDGFNDRPVKIPCGQCRHCRLERSRQWAIRCVHEASLHEHNCFITLTFAESYINPTGSLIKSDFQKFMKRLRKRYGNGIRYFHCGEYGDNFSRPHHHACLFNFDFPDKVFWKKRGGHNLYRSPSLEELWPFGFSLIGSVSFESAGYVARYIFKKITGKEASKHYGNLQSEYITMSRRPGIAYDWIRKYSSDVYPRDEIVIRGTFKCRPPAYYDAIFDLNSPEEMSIIKNKRRKKVKEKEIDSPHRLSAKAKVLEARLKTKERRYETFSV